MLDTTNKGTTSKENKGKKQKKIKVKEEKVDGGKGKRKGKVENISKTKNKGKDKGKKDSDDGSMDVDVESEDVGSDEDAEGEVVDDEDITKVKRKPRKSTTFRPKALSKEPSIATRSSKRLKLEATVLPTTDSTCAISTQDPSGIYSIFFLIQPCINILFKTTLCVLKFQKLKSFWWIMVCLLFILYLFICLSN